MWQPSLMLPGRSPLVLPRLWLPFSGGLPPYPSSTCCTREAAIACELCEPETFPSQWEVSISGLRNWLDDPPPCTQCESFDNTYYLTLASQGHAYIGTSGFPEDAFETGCEWEYILPSPVCEIEKLVLGIIGTSPSHVTLFVFFVANVNQVNMNWWKSYIRDENGQIDCNLQAEELNAGVHGYPIAEGSCRIGFSTCTVSAIYD